MEVCCLFSDVFCVISSTYTSLLMHNIYPEIKNTYRFYVENFS